MQEADIYCHFFQLCYDVVELVKEVEVRGALSVARAPLPALKGVLDRAAMGYIYAHLPAGIPLRYSLYKNVVELKMTLCSERWRLTFTTYCESVASIICTVLPTFPDDGKM